MPGCLDCIKALGSQETSSLPCMPDIAQLPKRSRRQVTSGTKGKLERQADLLIGEVRGQQLQGVSNGNGSPGLHEISSLPCLLGITPINTLQKLGQCSGFASQAVPEAPHHCSLLYVQRPAAHVSAFCHLLLALYCKVAVRMFALCFGPCFNTPKATVHLLQHCALCNVVACNTCLLSETGNLHGRQTLLTITNSRLLYILFSTQTKRVQSGQYFPHSRSVPGSSLKHASIEEGQTSMPADDRHIPAHHRHSHCQHNYLQRSP